jgi:hypothetical protein
MDPFGDFRDVMRPEARPPCAEPALFDERAIAAAVAGFRVVIVYGPIGSGRTHVARVAQRALYAAGRMTVEIDANFEYSANACLTRRGLDRRQPCTSAVVYVALTRVVRADAVTLHTALFLDEAALRRAYGLGLERLKRVYRCNLGALRQHRLYGVMPQSDVVTSGVGSAHGALAPSTSALLERVFLWQARRRAKDLRYVSDVYSDADVILEAHVRAEADCPPALLDYIAASVGNAWPLRAPG